MSKKAKKPKKGASSERPQLAVATYPRAAASARRAKGRGGLAGFGLVLLASIVHGGGLADALPRALIGGIVGYVAAWAVAVAVWRQILRARARVEIERTLEARRRAAAERH